MYTCVDLPTIISGDYVGIMDPHENVIKNEGKTGQKFPIRDFNRYTSQSAPFEGVFGYSNRISYYNGTLFRFPFRNNNFKSRISDRMYTAEEAHRVLYQSLAEEAPRLLLFLNHVTTVELYNQSAFPRRYTPDLLLKVSIQGDDVTHTRKWCIENSLTSQRAKGIQRPVCNISKCTIMVEGPLTRGVAQYPYLLCNAVGSDSLEMVELARKLKVIPWVGLAAPLPETISPPQQVMHGVISNQPNCKLIENTVQQCFHKSKKKIPISSTPAMLDNKGFAFCFLPMSSNNDTGLPVHIHGYFSLSDNRRRVRWLDLDDQSDEAKWNKYLMEHLITPAYAVLVTTSCSLMTFQFSTYSYQQLCSDAPFSLLPLLSKTREKAWKYLVERMLPLLSNLPVLWTPAGGGKWVKPSEAYCPPPNRAIPNSILDLLIQLGYPVVCFPQHIQLHCQLDVREITPQIVRNWFRHNELVKSKVNYNLSLLQDCLRYVTSDRFNDLINIPLLLLKSGNIISFGHQNVYIVVADQSMLLHNLDHMILSNDLYTNLWQIFNNIANYQMYKLTIADAHTVCVSLLPQSIQTWTPRNANPVQWTPNRNGHPSAEWLSNVWSFISNNQLLRRVTNLPLVVAEGPENVTNGGVYFLYHLDTGTLFRNGSDRDLNSIAQLLGCSMLVNSNWYFRFGHELNQYLPELNCLGLLHNLPNLPHVTQTVSHSLNDNDKRKLSLYLSSACQHFCRLSGTELSSIRSLPIFECGVGNGGSHFINLYSPQNYILPSTDIHFPSNLPFPGNILNVSSGNISLYQRATGAEPASLGNFAQQIYEFANRQHTSTRNKLLLWLIENSNPPNQNGQLERFISGSAIVPTTDGTLQYIRNLYDPKDSKLKDFFLPSEPFFPSMDFDRVLAKLRLYDLKTWDSVMTNNASFLSFIKERAKSVQVTYNTASKGEALNRSKLILSEIFKHPNRTDLLKHLMSIPFLFCEQSPPRGYPRQLPWAGSKVSRLCFPSELSIDYSQASLVGSASLFLSQYYPLTSEIASQGFTVVSPKLVMTHFINVVALPRKALKANSVSVMVKSIYEYLENHDTIVFLNTSTELACVWIDSECQFVTKDKCALEPLESCSLAPYRYSSQDASCLRNHKGLWLNSGLVECLTAEDGVNVVQEIHTSLGHDGTLDCKQLDIVVSVAEYLVEVDSVASISGFLLPTVHNDLREPSELTYDNHYIQRDPSEGKDDSFCFVHERITAKVAQFFKVQPLSIKAAPSSAIAIHFESTGPYESITHRIKGLVEDYGDNIDVFKELIQNADDAGATVVKFLISWKTFGQNNLLTREMAAWQGPALYAYNNKTFSESDLKNICKVAGQTKLTDYTKIGRFGVGFCATYHLTDVPSFVTKNQLLIFDPHLKYLGERVQPTKPGMQIDFVKENTGLQNHYSDQLAPYDSVFNCNTTNPEPNGFEGTLFRFPFRQPGVVSDICNDTFTKGSRSIESLKRSLIESASTILLFLQNVNSIELLEQNDGSATSSIFKLERKGETKGPFQKSFCLPIGRDFSQPPTSQIERITSVSGKNRKTTLWVVSSALGQRNSLEQAQSYNNEDGLIPLTEVAVKVCKEDYGVIPLNTEGGLSCFLPLPFGCSLDFHVNGFFDITKDRRLLRENLWNDALISDSLVLAVLELLQYLANNPSDMNSTRGNEFLHSYYQLFPTGEPKRGVVDSVRPKLSTAFEKELKETKKTIVWTKSYGGRWMAPSEVVVLGHDFLLAPFKDNQRDLICNLLVSQNISIIKVPSRLWYLFKGFTFQEFCVFFLDNISCFDTAMRDTMTIFILQHLETFKDRYSWLNDMIASASVIPTEPKGELAKATHLVDSSATDIASLFAIEEGRFAADNYMKNRQVVVALRSLGMARLRLKDEDVLERAHSISNVNVDTAISRSRLLVHYLLEYHFKVYRATYSKPAKRLSESDKKLAASLSEVVFLPVMKCPNSEFTCWRETDAIFMKSFDMFPSSEQKLVFTHSFILDGTVPHSLTYLLTFKRNPNLQEILNHLKAIISWWRNEKHGLHQAKEVLKFLDEITKEIYSYLALETFGPESDAASLRIVKNKDAFTLMSTELKEVPFIWQESDFYNVHCVFFEEKYKCPPYLVTLGRLSLSTAELFKKLGVDDIISQKKLLLTLQAIKTDFMEISLPREILDFTIYCSKKLYMYKENANLFLPDVDGIMRNKESLMYSDQQIQTLFARQECFKSLEETSSSKRQYRLHPKISFETAQDLGIQSPLEALLSNYRDNSVISAIGYGQHEDLCDRLSNILRNYHADTSIFKEFIQNADDAGASEIVFILDQRNFKDKTLFDPRHSNWRKLQHVPSLLVFNNKKFTDKDITGIAQLGKGTKDNSPETIGRFGIGFNVAYHVTDCPMFVSHSEGGKPENFCTFDPTLQFVPGSDMYNPGKRWMLQGELGDISEVFEDQMAPFATETLKKLSSICPHYFQDSSKKWPNGFVLFRLPFVRTVSKRRCIKEAKEMTTKNMNKLFLSFCSNIGENCLLFLNSVRKIAFFEISEKNKCSLLGSFTASLDKKGTHDCASFRSEMLSFPSSLKSGNQINSSSAVYEVTTQTIDRHSNTQRQQWVVSKRLGSNDITPELQIKASQCSFLPFGGVAASVPDFTKFMDPKVVKKSTQKPKGMVYCYLPLPHESKLPVHVNGHFWLSDSRRDLQHGNTHDLKDWNRELVQQTVMRAYVELLMYCKRFFVQDKEFLDWFYSLFPQPDIKGVLESFKLPEHLFCYLFLNHVGILISLDNSSNWLSFNGPEMGLFYSPLYQEPKPEVLISLGIKLTNAPSRILHSLKASLISQNETAKFSGRVSAAFLRDHLRSIAKELHVYENVIKANIIPLLHFVLNDIDCKSMPSPKWEDALNGVPLMVTNNNQLRLMCNVYDDRHSDLLPTCQEHFILKDIANESAIYTKLQDLGVIKKLADNPEFVAKHLALPKLSHEQVLPFNKVDKILLTLFWKYLKDCLRENVFQSFSNFIVIPTTNDNIYPLSRRKVILSAKSNRIKLINEFKLPVLCLEKVFDQDLCIGNWTFKQYFADPDNADDIFLLLKFHKNVLPQLEDTVEKEVYNLIEFLDKSEELHKQENQTWLKELPLFQLLSKKLSRIDSFRTVFGLYRDSIPTDGLSELTDMRIGIAFVTIPMYCENFLSKAGVNIIQNRPHAILELYRDLVSHFHRECFTPEVLLPHVEYIKQLYYQAGPSKKTRSSWNVIISILTSLKFIRKTDNTIAAPRDLYDPNVELFSEFKQESDFPPTQFDSLQWLDFLSLLGLNRKVNSQLWLSFAKSLIEAVNDNEDFGISKRKAILLLANLAEQIRTDDLRPSADFLCQASSLAIVPSLDEKSPSDVLSYIIPDFKMPVRGWNTIKGSVIQLEDHDWELSCLCRPVLPKEFNISTNLGFIKTLGICRVTPIIAAENLKELSKILSVCKELPDRRNTLEILHQLQDIFLSHYACINSCEKEDEPNLKELLQTSNCLYILDGQFSFKLVPGSHTVVKRPDLHSCIETVPEYCKSLIKFLDIIGSSSDLTINHCCIFLKTLWHNTRLGEVGLNPNEQSDARRAYDHFVTLSRLIKDPFDRIYQDLHIDNLPLLSEEEKLELATNLILNDAPWYRERLHRTSKCYKFIKTPPKDNFGNPSLPEWLGIPLLSSLIVEKPHPKMLNKANLCNAERVAAEERGDQHCPYLQHLKTVLKSDYFFNGLLRLIKYETKNPPSDELVETLKSKLDNIELVCVQLITTVLVDENNEEISNSLDSSSSCLIMPSEDVVSCTVYIAPHESDSTSPVDRNELLYRLFVGLNQQFGHVVHDSHIFMEMLSCQQPDMIGSLLSSHKIPEYIHGSDKNFARSPLGCDVPLTPYLDHIILFNFKVGEIVKFKSKEHASLINAEIVALEGKGLPTKCHLKVKPTMQGEDDQIKVVHSCVLLLSKYMPAGYEYSILKAWKIDTKLPDSIAETLPGPISVLNFSVTKADSLRAELKQLYTGINKVFTHEQKKHTTVRLLYQIHYLCRKMECMDVFDEAFRVLTDVASSFGISCQLEVERGQLIGDQAEVNPNLMGVVTGSTGYGGVSTGSTGYGGVATGSTGYGGPNSRSGGGSTPRRVRFSNLWSGGQHFRDPIWRSPVEVEPPPQPNLEEASMWLMQALNDFNAALSLLKQSQQIKAANQNQPNVLEVFPAQVCFLLHKSVEKCKQSQQIKAANQNQPNVLEVFPAQVCFLLHESVEKCLKALFLALFGLDRKLSGHTNVMDLCQELQGHCDWVSGVDLMPQVLQVSGHFMKCRYPGYNLPKQAPAYSYADRFSEAEEVVEAVKVMYQTIKEKFPSVKQMMDNMSVRLPDRRDEHIDPTSKTIIAVYMTFDVTVLKNLGDLNALLVTLMCNVFK